jgi:hypothetical protein
MITTYQGSVLPTIILDENDRAVLEVSQVGGTRYIRIPTRESMTLFEQIGIKLGDLNANFLNLFATMSVGRDLKARPVSIEPPKHVLSSRKNNCDWQPKGSTTFNALEIDTHPFQVNIEQCPAQFWTDCFERIFAPGPGVKDMLSTAEGRALYERMIRAIYLGLGNSAFMALNFSNHPTLGPVNATNKYKVSAGEWADFYDQQTSTALKGLITQMDELANNGEPGFDIPLLDGSFNAQGKFIGNIIDLLEALRASAKGDFGDMLYAELAPDQTSPVFLLSPALFEAYREYLVTTHAGSTEAFRYQMTGVDGTVLQLRNVLSYYGMPVVRWNICNSYDSIVGTTSHRAALVAPGALAIAYSGEIPQQYEGMGLQIVQHLDPPHKGKVFMDTYLRLGAHVVKNFVTYARNVKLPA